MLKLDTAGQKLFEDPKILFWLKYVDAYNAKNPAKATTPLTTLKKTYNDETLLNMLQTASQVWSTRSVAMRLETEQMKVWKSKGFTVDDLFKKYKLDSDLNPFANPAITILGRYSDEFNPNKGITLFSILQRKYTDGKLAQLLGDARRVWKARKQFFISSSLKREADNLLDNPQLLLWFHYVDFFEQNTQTSPFVKSIKTTVAEMLARRYDNNDLKTLMKSGTFSVTKRLTARLENELLDIWAKGGKSLEYVTKTLGTSPTKTKLVHTVYVDMLTKQRFRVWLDNLESPESVFKFLMLDKGPENLLDSPQLKAWLQYTTTFRRENPYARQVNLIDILMSHYGDRALSKILQSAKLPSRSMASTLEDALVSRWVRAGKSVEYVKDILGSTTEKKLLLEATYKKKLQALRSAK
ncbi:Avirulence (Avh) protein [Phytophthora megakarya]|uniref:Avirulence (Avh) protein n=1 Tax=Phytophthora megakarya TaxID=4795 RepID=A0A225UPR5_9STRA|nr:Avirulence (Avh) protein [Phytophthora megakarya]